MVLLSWDFPDNVIETMTHTLRYDAGAGAYDRLTGRWSRMYVEAVLDATRVTAGSHVLDVATGTGDAAIVAADRVGLTGRVVAVDVSAPMLLEAAAKAGPRRIEFLEADAQRLPFDGNTFDAVICLFGLMFVTHPVDTLKGLRRLLRSNGTLAATCWGAPLQAPFAGLVAEALAAQLPDDRDDLLRPFSLCDAEATSAIFTAAGFTDVATALEARSSRFMSFDDDFWEPIEAGGGRLGQAYLSLPPAQRHAVRQDVLGRLPVHASNEPFTLNHHAWLVVGHG